jgi:phospholipase A1
MKIVFLFIVMVVLLVGAESNVNNDKCMSECDMNEIPDIVTKKYMQKWIDSKMGLEPHKANYLLPYGYADKIYKSYVPSDEYKHIEAELQVSLKMNVGNNLFGLDEMYYASYSQKSFWQVYTKSSPFRETNYNPELFVVFPIEDNSLLGLQSINLKFAHLSNGQGNIEEVDSNISSTFGIKNRSRSINYFSTTIRFQHKSLITDLEIWIPNSFNGDLSDNPDIMNYLGYTGLNFKYFYEKSLFTLMARLNIDTGFGAIELGYSYPIIEDVYFYTKVFNGYGESLIDYDNNINKVAFGFSFSR